MINRPALVARTWHADRSTGLEANDSGEWWWAILGSNQ